MCRFFLRALPCDACMQLACQWCCAVVDESDNNILAILKALALLQLAASHANALHDVTITSTPASSGDTAAQPAAEAEQLLPHLQPCVSLLAGATSQAPVQVLRSQASLTLQQLLQGLPPPVCHACLRQLLSQGEDGGGVHPEVAALLMQEVRGLLVKKSAAGGDFARGNGVALGCCGWCQKCLRAVLAIAFKLATCQAGACACMTRPGNFTHKAHCCLLLFHRACRFKLQRCQLRAACDAMAAAAGPNRLAVSRHAAR